MESLVVSINGVLSRTHNSISELTINGVLSRTHNSISLSSNAFNLSSLRIRKSQVLASKNNNNNNNNNNPDKKKQDRHSFVPKPDETTGIFPESVLLKQKVVQEDGKLLPEFADADEQELYEALSLMLESDLDTEQNRHYEVVYLIHENFEEEVEKVNLKIQEFLSEKKARVYRVSDWGLRRLAYKIQKAKNAHYILMNFEIEAKWINEFKSMLDKDERVIRHLVMKQDKAITEECIPPPEFHTLRADMDDNDDDDDDDDEEEYDDDDEGDYDDESIENGEDSGIVYVDEDSGDHEDREPAGLKIGGRRKLEKSKK